MQTKSSAATTARPTTPTQAAALPPAAPSTETTMAMTQIVGRITLKVSAKKRPARLALRDAEKAALARWSTMTPTTPTQAAALPPAAPSTETTMAQILGRIPLKERPARLAPTASPQRATRRTPLTIAALEAALPTWKLHTPTPRTYSVDRYIDPAGLAALAHKMGAKVVFEGGLSPNEYLAARRAARDARRAEAARIDADRAAANAAILADLRKASEEALALKDARAARRAALKAERTALVAALAAETGVTTAAARRALLDAEGDVQGARDALALAAMKAEERKEAKAERKDANDALAAAPDKVKTALKSVKNQALKGRIALALAELKGRLLTVGLKAALALAATTPDANTTLTTDRLQWIIASAVEEERIRRDFAVERKLKMKAAIKARSEEVTNLFARAKGGEKGTPQALTLAISLARKVRG